MGVAISCATCAIREKQRSRTGDLDKRPENHAPNLFFSFHRPPPLPILFALEKAEHASAKKIETCINVCYGLDIRNSRITVRSNGNDTLPPMFLSSWRSSIEFVTKRIDVRNIREKETELSIVASTNTRRSGDVTFYTFNDRRIIIFWTRTSSQRVERRRDQNHATPATFRINGRITAGCVSKFHVIAEAWKSVHTVGVYCKTSAISKFDRSFADITCRSCIWVCLYGLTRALPRAYANYAIRLIKHN